MKGLETARELAGQIRPTQTPSTTGRAPRLTIEKMRRALPEFQDTSDRDLVELWSQANGRDFGELADEVGLPTSSTLGEMGGQFGQGLRVDTPRMVGQALQYFSGGDNQFAQRMIEGAERRGLTALPDPRGRGAIANDALIAGARGLGPVAATLATSVIPYAGQVIAPALAAATFGGSGAYETYQRVFDETGDAAAASAAARRVGVLQGGGEAIATMAGGALIRPAVAAVRGAPTTARVVDALTDTRVLRPAAAGIAKNTAVQVGTEIGQDVGTSMIESAYGAQDEDLGQIAYQSGMAAAGMSLLLGGFGVRGYHARARQADRIQKALDGDPSVAPEDRARILGVVNQEAERRGVSMTDRETWVREQLLPAEQRKNETLDRMEQIRAEIALTDRTNTVGREKLVAEFRSLYDAPSGERAPAEDGTEVVLTNGQLMAREITAMRERQRAEQQTQKDPDAEIDITQAPAQEDFKVDTDTLFASFIDEQSLPTLEQLQNTDVTTMAPEVRNEFEAALRMASRPTMSVKNRAVQLRRAVDILETTTGVPTFSTPTLLQNLGAPLDAQQAPTNEFAPAMQQATELDMMSADQVSLETAPGMVDPNSPFNIGAEATAATAPGIAAPSNLYEGDLDQLGAVEATEQTAPGVTPAPLSYGAPISPTAGYGMMAPERRPGQAEDLVVTQPLTAQGEMAPNYSPRPGRAATPAAQTPSSMEFVGSAQVETPANELANRTDAELQSIVSDTSTRVPAINRRKAAAELERRQAPAALPPIPRTQRAPDAEQRVPAEPVADADIEIDTEEDNKRIDTLFKELDAEVEGADAPKSMGRVTWPKNVLIAIRNAILNPGKKGQTVVRVPGTTAIDEAATARYQPAIARVAKAANDFASSYDAIITKARNLVSAKDKEFRGSEQEMSEINAILRVGADMETEFSMYDDIRNASPAVRAWFERRVKGTSLKDLIDQHEVARLALVNEFGTDTKNIDAIVRLVKDRAQTRLNTGAVGSAAYKRLRKIDLTLSRAWNAARRGVEGVEQAFDVRPGESRSAKEAKIQRGAIEVALGGVDAKGKESGPGGIVGVMDYYTKNGTVYEKTLARAIRAVVINMGDNAPTMKLTKGSKPSYNPANNTITIGADASPSVILHESLHGALQWYVYNNQSSPQVAQLIEAVERVVAYNGNLGAKAQEVQNILAKLVKDDRMIDAVLELVSYGNTLNEFRRALDQMGTIGTPLTFRENVEKVWRSILNVVNTMLGLKPNATLANDVIKNTFMLLEGAASFKIDNAMDAGRRGGVLKMEVFSSPSTPRFWKWFGESVVLDGSGDPRIVYHGTSASENGNAFKEFQIQSENYGLMGAGAYFTESSEIASEYTTKGKGATPTVYPVYLAINNPIDMDAPADAAKWEAAFPDISNYREPKDPNTNEGWYRAAERMQQAAMLPKWEGSDNLLYGLREMGYDGVTHIGGGRAAASKGKQHRVWVAFDSDQIMSAVGADGAAAPKLIPLRELGDPMAAGRQEGKTLYATVTGTDLPARDADASTGQYQRAMPQKNLEKFNKKILPEWMSSKFLFDSYGGWWGNTMKAIDEKGLSRLSAHIQETSPRLTTVIKWVNNNYGLQGAVADLMLRAKDDRRGGSIQVEVLADHLASLPTEITRKVLASLDARLDALRKGEVLPPIEGIDRKTGIDLLANDMLDRWWEYARTTRDDKLRARMAGVYNPKTKQWEGGVKFSQGLIVPDTLKNIVSPTFGEQALSKFTKPRSKTELNEDAIMMRTDSNGDPVLTDKFIGLYQLDAEYQKARKEGTPMASLEPHAFISVERFLAGERPTWNGLPMDFDNAYMWTLERKGDKGYKLSAQLDLSSAAAAKSSQQIAAAIQNTMGILANSYSATRLTDSLYAHGRGTPNAVAYDNLDELNSVLQGKYVNDKFEPQTDRSKWANQVRRDNVLKAEERGAEAVRDKFNISNSWVRVPDNPTYGALRNKIVQGSVWNAVQDAYDTRPVIALQQANTIMRWFKKAKTQYNPATWATNVATNFTMAILDDIPMQTVATASRLYFGYMLPENIKKKLGVNINLTREEQELMAGILGTNAMLGTVSTAELRQDVFEAMRDSFSGQELSVPSRIMQLMGMEKRKLEAFEKRYGAGKEYVGDRTEAFDKFTSDWYAAQDNVFRVASMLNKLGQMKSEGRVIDAEAYRVAGDHARFAFLDYDIDSKAVKLMRQTAFPFISWPYAAAKLIGHVAVHKPWKLVNLYAGYWMLDALLQTITGDDEEELRKAGPEWARDRMFFGMGPHTHLRVPFLGDDENPVYYNLGKYIAPSSFGETVPNPFLGLDWWPSFITPGGPFISSALVVTAGVDPFTGDKISPPTASAWEAAGDRVGMVQSMFVPNLPFVSATETTKFFEAMTARTDRSENYDDLYLARLAGLRFYDFNVDGARQAQSRAAQAIRRDFDVQISRLRRSMLRHETPDYDKFIREREKLRARLDERLAELTGDDNNL